MSSSAWQVAAAAVVGPSHEAEGIGCQDSFALRVTPEGWLLAAVCDGAGSALRSAEGSQALAYAMIQNMDALPLGSAEQARGPIAGIIRGTRAVLRAAGGRLDVFHATLVFAAIGPEGGWFAQIGDGAALALDQDLQTLAMSGPENGEYANETYFFTQSDWQDHLRLTPVPAGVQTILLMSDGCTPFALARGERGPFLSFLKPVHDYLRAASREQGERALVELLSRKKLASISGDDKTLLWACRQPRP